MKFIEIKNLRTFEGKYSKDEAYRTAMLNADRILWFYRENDNDYSTELIHIRLVGCDYEDDIVVQYTDRLWTALLSLDDKDYENLKEKNKLLGESNANLDETYFDAWHACERLKENSAYALMFVDDAYCLVNTEDNKFDIIDDYEVNSKGIIDNGTQKKLRALEIIKEKKINLEYLKCCETYEQYKTVCSYWYEITQKEYDLLKEVLS